MENKKALENSILEQNKLYKDDVGKVCEHCGYLYEEHSESMQHCPDYNLNKFANDTFAEKYKNCLYCEYYYKIPEGVMSTKDKKFFVCSRLENLYQNITICDFFKEVPKIRNNNDY
jgi:hypothetical protein